MPCGAHTQDIHTHPELGFEEHRTSDLVAQLLASWGIETVIGAIGGPTAVVGILHGKVASGHSIGLRADMDGLPMQEVSERPYKSGNDVRCCSRSLYLCAAPR